MAQLIVRGEVDSISLYNLTTGLQHLNINSNYKIEKLYEVVKNLLESGELDALILPDELKLISLENLDIELDEEPLDNSSLILKNSDLEYMIDTSTYKEGMVFLIRHYRGDGEYIFEDIDDDFDINNLSFEYIDCAQELNQYDILRESYLENFCDSVLADSIKYKDEPLEFDEFIFDPQLVKDELYIVKKDPISNLNVLEKLDVGGNRLFGTDCDVDDFERN
jgi:hypothetical protein